MFREKNVRKTPDLFRQGSGRGIPLPGHEYCPDAGFDRLGKESVGWKSRDGSPGKTGRDRKIDLHVVPAEIYLDRRYRRKGNSCRKGKQFFHSLKEEREDYDGRRMAQAAF